MSTDTWVLVLTPACPCCVSHCELLSSYELIASWEGLSGTSLQWFKSYLNFLFKYDLWYVHQFNWWVLQWYVLGLFLFSSPSSFHSLITAMQISLAFKFMLVVWAVSRTAIDERVTGNLLQLTSDKLQSLALALAHFQPVYNLQAGIDLLHLIHKWIMSHTSTISRLHSLTVKYEVRQSNPAHAPCSCWLPVHQYIINWNSQC